MYANACYGVIVKILSVDEGVITILMSTISFVVLLSAQTVSHSVVNCFGRIAISVVIPLTLMVCSFYGKIINIRINGNYIKRG